MSEHVIYNGARSTIGELIEVKRQIDPLKAKVNYFDLKEAPTEASPGAFDLAQKTAIFYSIQPVIAGERTGQEKTKEPIVTVQAQMGGHVPASTWSSHISEIIFSVKWIPSGLAPIRPVVVLSQAIEIPPKHNIMLD